MLLLMIMDEKINHWDEDWADEQISLMAQGDTAALERIYSLTKASVYAYLLSVLKNKMDAEDAMQDTYVGLFQAAAGYRPNRHAKAFLFTIARNQAMMRFREQRRFSPQSEELLETYPEKDYTDDALERLTLDHALSILSKEEGQIVTLHAIAGFKHKEIASLLHLPLNTVLSKYHRAMKQLKSELTKEV